MICTDRCESIIVTSLKSSYANKRFNIVQRFHHGKQKKDEAEIRGKECGVTKLYLCKLQTYQINGISRLVIIIIIKKKLI